MRTAPSPHLVYRIVQHDPPTPDDFTPRAPPAARAFTAVDPRLLTGISVFARGDRAMRVARRYPKLGSYVAELRVPSSATIERTSRARGHYTLWAAPAELLGAVRRVRRVE